MTELETLQSSIETLLDRYSSLQLDYKTLQEENERQREEILRTHAELLTLQEQYKALRVARSMAEEPEQQELAKKHLANIIAQVDRAIEILKQ